MMYSSAAVKPEVINDEVPVFVMKLWAMVNSSDSESMIGWTHSGTEFYIRNQARFNCELLPVFYKHNNLASFVRQLNTYGFKKMKLVMADSLKNESDMMLFSHPSFIRNHPELLAHICRRQPRPRYDQMAGSQQQQQQQPANGQLVDAKSADVLSRVLDEMKAMHAKHDTLESHLSTMRRENESLWREVLVLRQRHSKQQQTLNKLIQFLVSIVHPAGRSAAAAAAAAAASVSVQRKHLPMLDKGDGSGGGESDPARCTAGGTTDDSGGDGGSVDKLAECKDLAALSGLLGGSAQSPEGPIIRDVTDLLSPMETDAAASSYVREDAVRSAVSSPGRAGDTPVNPAVSPAAVVSPSASAASASAPSTSAVISVRSCESDVLAGIASGGANTVTGSGGGGGGPSLLRCDSMLDEIQSDMDGLRELFGSVCGSSLSAAPSSWQESLLAEASAGGSSNIKNSTVPAGHHSACTAAAAGASDLSTNQTNQLMPYYPSLYELLSTTSDLFPDLQGIDTPQPPAQQSPPPHSPHTSPLPPPPVSPLPQPPPTSPLLQPPPTSPLLQPPPTSPLLQPPPTSPLLQPPPTSPLLQPPPTSPPPPPPLSPAPPPSMSPLHSCGDMAHNDDSHEAYVLDTLPDDLLMLHTPRPPPPPPSPLLCLSPPWTFVPSSSSSSLSPSFLLAITPTTAGVAVAAPMVVSAAAASTVCTPVGTIDHGSRSAAGAASRSPAAQHRPAVSSSATTSLRTAQSTTTTSSSGSGRLKRPLATSGAGVARLSRPRQRRLPVVRISRFVTGAGPTAATTTVSAAPAPLSSSVSSPALSAAAAAAAPPAVTALRRSQRR